LGLGSDLAGDDGAGDGPLLHAVDRFAGEAVEDEEQAHFGDLRDGRDGLAVAADVEQGGRRSEIVVPDVVMNELLVPELFAGAGVEGNEGVAVEVVAGAVGAVEVVGGGAEGGVEDAAGGVEGEEAPGVGAGAVFVGAGGPGVAAGFAGAGDGVEGPEQFAGDGVPGADVAVGADGGRAFPVARSGDDDVFKDRRRRLQLEAAVGQAVEDPGFEVHAAFVAEAGGGFAVGGVDGQQVVAVAGEQAGVERFGAGPVGEAADGYRRGGVLPEQFARLRHESVDAVRGVDVEYALKDKRDRLRTRFTEAEGPGRLQLGYVGRVDLAERGPAHGAGVVAEVGPFGLSGEQDGQEKKETAHFNTISRGEGEWGSPARFLLAGTSRRGTCASGSRRCRASA
jgi:hypothetical protein